MFNIPLQLLSICSSIPSLMNLHLFDEDGASLQIHIAEVVGWVGLGVGDLLSLCLRLVVPLLQSRSAGGKLGVCELGDLLSLCLGLSARSGLDEMSSCHCSTNSAAVKIAENFEEKSD